MTYIVDRSKIIPVNTTNYTPNKQPSQTKDPYPDVYKYQMNDLNSVFTHWDNNLKKNVATPNELPVVGDDEK